MIMSKTNKNSRMGKTNQQKKKIKMIINKTNRNMNTIKQKRKRKNIKK